MVDAIEHFVLDTYDRIASLKNITSIESANIDGNTLYVLDNKYPIQSVSGRRAEPIAAQPTRYEAVQFDYLWQALPVRTAFELHAEYFTINNTVDLSLLKRGDLRGPEALELERHIAALRTETSNRKGWGGALSRAPKPGALAEAYQFIYEEFWGRFEEKVFGGQLRQDAAAPPPGSVFADFRSFYARRGKGSDLIAAPAGGGKERRGAPYREEEAAAAGRKLQSFMASTAPKKEPRQKPEQIEYTLSGFQAGQALYLTSLGGQRAALRSIGKPVTYICLMTHGDREQTGRLLDTLNTVGDSRLAALYDLAAVVTAGQKLRSLGKELREIGDDLAQLVPDKKEDLQEISQSLSNAIGRLTNISRENGSETIQGGLMYRVQRSRYYQRQFDDMVALLRIKPIEGFQPYDRFVRRRMGSTYRFIDMVGIRYERAQNNASALTERLSQVQVADLNKTLVRLGNETSWWFAYLVGPVYGNQLMTAITGLIEQTAQNVFKLKDLPTTWHVIKFFAIAGATAVVSPTLYLQSEEGQKAFANFKAVAKENLKRKIILPFQEAKDAFSSRLGIDKKARRNRILNEEDSIIARGLGPRRILYEDRSNNFIKRKVKVLLDKLKR